jgi:hypothetical protein
VIAKTSELYFVPSLVLPEDVTFVTECYTVVWMPSQELGTPFGDDVSTVKAC